MASRFDQIPTFNPYIQDAPMELLSQVAFSKQQKYYEGVQAVQSYVDKIAGLPVIKDVDKQYLNGKLQQLGQDIGAVAGEDFSNPFLVSKLGNIAHGISSDPILQNAVQGSQQVVDEKAYWEGLRKSNPELYNPKNEAYGMIDVNNWLSDNTAGSKLINNHGRYTYYDFSKEVRDAMKDFKPTSVKRKLPNGEWLISKTDASWTDPEVREYLNGVLSDRARQQMKIDGVVNFLGRDNDLLSAYYNDLKGRQKNNNARIKDYQAKMTVENSDTQELFKQKINQLKEQNLEIIDLTGKIDNRDLDFFNANKEGIAGSLFSEAYLSAATSGYSHADIIEEYSPNEIWKTKFIQSMENSRLNTRLQFDRQENALDRDQREDLKLLELGYKYRDASGNIRDIPVTHGMEKVKANISEDDKSNIGREVHEQRKAQTETDRDQAFKTVRNKLLTQSPQLNAQFEKFLVSGGKEFSTTDPSWVATQKYLTTQASLPKSKRDVWADTYIDRINALNMKDEVSARDEKNIEKVITREFGRDLQTIEDKINNLGPLTLNFQEDVPVSQRTPGGKITRTESKTITPQKVRELLFNTNATVNQLRSPDYQGDGIAYAPGPGGHLYVKIGGKLNTYTRGAIPSQLREIMDATGKNKDLLKRAEQRRNQLYNQAIINEGDWWTSTDEKDPRVIAAKTLISNRVGGKPEEFSIAQADATTGEIQFRLNPQGGPSGKTTNIDKSIMESYGITYNSENKTYAMKDFNIFKRDNSGINEEQQVAINSLQNNVNLEETTIYSPSLDPNGNGEYIRLVRDINTDGGSVYWIYSDNHNVMLDYQNFQDPTSAMNAAKTLTANPERFKILIDQKTK